MGARFRVGYFPEEAWISRRFDEPALPDALAVSTLEATWQLQVWFPDDQRGRSLLIAVCEALGHPVHVSPGLDLSRLRGLVRDALLDGRLRAYRLQSALSGASPPKAEPSEPTGPSARSDPKTWFEVAVVDEEGEPVPGLNLVFSQGGRNEKLETSGSGVARWRDVEASSSFGLVRIASLMEARKALADRVCEPFSEKAPPGTRLVVGEDELRASIEAETPATLILARPLLRVRLIGMHFDSNKCFLLNSAMRGIRQVVDVYRRDPNGTLLIVGHTDTEADPAYNLDLSVERAEAMNAYLTDDVAAWEAWFGGEKPWIKRWGSREIKAMIEALPCAPSVAGFQAWSNETRGTELKVDGDPGPKTRRALIEAYMAIDGTTLPQGMNVAIHGCGEFFPRDPTGDEVADPENRRVEIFCFHHDVVPPVPGRKAKKGEPQYAEWVKQVTRNIDVEINAEELWIRLHDDASTPMTNVPYCVVSGGKIHAEGTSEDGWVVVFLPDNACPDTVRVEWGPPDGEGVFPFQMNVRVECGQGSERAQASAKLHNLGYPTGSDALYEQAVRDFQRDYAVGEEGLEEGHLPPKTRDELAAIFGTDCDATRPPSAPEPSGALDEPAALAFDSQGTASCFG